MDRAVHWFRRDLRLGDHRALARATEAARGALCLFVLDPEILGRADTGAARVHHLCGALRELDRGLRERGSALVVRHGDPVAVVPAFAREAGAALVTAVRDAEPHARRRDEAVGAALGRAGGRLWLSDEQWLVPPPEAPRVSVFGAFWRTFEAALERDAVGDEAEPRWGALLPARELPPSQPLRDAVELVGNLEGTIPAAGERAAIERLEHFAATSLPGYRDHRDAPGRDGTSRLSPHLRFGAISVRTVLRRAGGGEGGEKFVREIAWRDFYAHVLWQRPEVEHRAFRPEMDAIRWDSSPERFEAWRQGRTGFPMVDAAMRQLRAEHWVHNRARMVAASFLCKDLHLDWRLGEREFMLGLVDGDLASNNGGWQWTASTGTDPQPYFRVFNPELQRRRFDPDGSYVRRWIPELGTPDYPPPMVDHLVERRRAIRDYAAAAAR